MTEVQMRTLFEERYNLSSNVNDDKEDDELYLYLNSAVNRFIKQRFTGNNFRQIPFEGDPKRMDDLRTLIKKSGDISVDVAAIPEITNGKQYVVPTDFMFLIKGYCKISTNWYSCERITNDESYLFIETSLNSPIIREGKILYETELNYTVLVDPDNFANLDVTKLEYIKEPDVIASGTNCNLPDHTHEEIVEIAVQLAVEGIENLERFQTHSEVIKGNE